MLRKRFEPVLLRRSGAAVALWGEPGVGKTHAAAGLLAQLPCRSLSVQATVPLSTLARRLPRPARLPAWAAATLGRLETSSAVEPARAVEALSAALARSAPFVLLVEDLHEADEERAALLTGLAGAVRRTRGVGLLVTSRADPGEAFQRLRLEPLGPAETRALLRGALGAELPGEAADWIVSRSSGNPLFALEYLRYLSRQGHLWSDGSSWRWRRPPPGAPPPTIEALIEHFLAHALADRVSAAVLSALAVLPSGPSDGRLVAASGLSPTEFASGVRDLERRGVLARGGFAHPLYREVAARLLPPEERREAARRALAVPDHEPAHVGALVAAADLDAPDAVELLTRAAENARRAGDDALAARLLAQASDTSSGEERGRLALEAARLLVAKDYPRMLELAERAAAVLADPTEALLVQAGGLSVMGDHGAMERVLSMVPAETKRGATWLEQRLRLLHQAGRREELITAWEASPHREEVDAATVYYVGWAYLHAGATRTAADLVAEWLAKPSLSEAGRSELMELQASIAFYAGDAAAAERIFTEVLERTEAAGAMSAPNAANLLRNRAVARMQQARVAECLPDLEAALRVYEEVGHGLHHAGTLVMMSYAYEELGAYERAEEVLAEALETARRSGAKRFLGSVLAQLADLYLEWPGMAHPALALRYASQAVEATVDDPGGIEALTAKYLLARALTATGRPDEGLELAEQALAQAAGSEVAEAVMACRYAVGLAQEALGRVEEAAGSYEAARALAAESGMPVHEHRYGLESDRLAGDRDSAGRRLAWFEVRRLASGANVARRYFPELGDRAETRPPAPALRLEVLGPLRLRRGEEVSAVRGRRRRALLLALAEARLAGDQEVGRLALVEHLYPAADEARAVASLKQLVSDVRRELGSSVIVTTTTGYALGDVATDAEDFLAGGDTLEWRGELGEGAQWDVRESVRLRLLASLSAATQAVIDVDAAEAARSAALLRRHDPFDPEYLRLHLQALTSAGLPKTLEEEYERARALFAEVGEQLPGSAAAFLEGPAAPPPSPQLPRT